MISPRALTYRLVPPIIANVGGGSKRLSLLSTANTPFAVTLTLLQRGVGHGVELVRAFVFEELRAGRKKRSFAAAIRRVA
jgi:hypothetical protein